VEFDLTTVLLEAANFLVLVWLLKRFLYRPIMDVIERRRADSEKMLADAEKERRDAEALKEEYAARLAEAGRQRDLALAQLEREIGEERARRLAAVKAEADGDRERRRMLAAQEAERHEAALERQALTIAARFASRFLERLADPALEAKLVDMALAELSDLPADRLAVVGAALRETEDAVEVVTAHPLDAARQSALAARLDALAGRALTPAFREDAALKSGLRVTAGAWVLMANLRDELEFFTEPLAHGG
jgi:F-type H+-transporting ATPase subunit b